MEKRENLEKILSEGFRKSKLIKIGRFQIYSKVAKEEFIIYNPKIDEVLYEYKVSQQKYNQD